MMNKVRTYSSSVFLAIRLLVAEVFVIKRMDYKLNIFVRSLCVSKKTPNRMTFDSNSFRICCWIFLFFSSWLFDDAV